jgi:hypothetical protein
MAGAEWQRCHFHKADNIVLNTDGNGVFGPILRCGKGAICVSKATGSTQHKT